MKTLLKISIILILFASSEMNAQTFNLVEANTSADCKNLVTGFKITKANIAYNFDLKIIPEWIQCSDMDNTDYNMAGIRVKNNSVFMYQCYIYKNGVIKESSELSKFILGPGEYELVISSNPGNLARLTYYTGSDIPLSLSQK